MSMLLPHDDEHFIDEGRVYCPVRDRDVEYDMCAGCRWCARVDLEARPPVVHCRPERPPLWMIRPWL